MRFAHPSTTTAAEIDSHRAAFVGFASTEGMRRQEVAGCVMLLSERNDRA
jgi:hypothetical protein